MQHDVDTVATIHPIEILGINTPNSETDFSVVCAGKTIAWLQDVGPPGVEASWQANHRDVIVLNAQNEVVAVYNLNPPNNLADAAKYAELRAILISAAQAAAPARAP